MTIHLAFYRGRKKDNPNSSFFDRLVCLVDFAKWSHVEIVCEFDKSSRTGHIYSSSPRDKGVRSSFIHFNPAHWDIFEYDGPTIPNAPTNTHAQVYTWFKPKLGLKYDWVGAVATKLIFFKQRFSKYFCSEIIAEFFGFKKAHKYTPKGLYHQLKYWINPVSF